MKNLILAIFLLFILIFSAPGRVTGQTISGTYPHGEVITERLTSEALKNPGGENPTRRVTVYLPPGYEDTDEHYPVIYYLHGFTWNDSIMIAVDHFDLLLDKAIATGKIRPVIVVMPDQYTLYRGSWYTNSTLTGKWVDFTAIELVEFIDRKYRTIPDRNARGLAGHSMGGYGALRIGMLNPDVFSSVYALSPATLGLIKEIGPEGTGYKRVNEITREEMITGYANFHANVVIAMGRAITPNPDKPPYFADVPFTYENGKLHIDYATLARWNENSPLVMADDFVENLKMLKALKLDWGRNEEHLHIPVTCRMFSEKLESLGVNHYAEEYIGTHFNKLWTNDGRALNDLLPFFNDCLQFEGE